MPSIAPLSDQADQPRTAVVTGADSGIGEAVALAFAGGGLDVGITYNSDEQGARSTADRVASEGVRAAVRKLDLIDLPTQASVIDDLTNALGGVDVLVNCAGTTTSAPVMELDFDTWRRILSVDLDGAFACTQRAAKHMIEAGRGGRIINITSVHEHTPKVGAAAYCAAKAGLGALTKVLALELSGHGITVNSVAPGEISTPMTGQGDTDPMGQPRPGIPLGRPGHAREVASVVAFLATPAAQYVTGASWVVDGGMSQMGPQGASALSDDGWRRA